MSSSVQSGAAAHAGHAAPHGSIGRYTVGFIGSLVFTILSFGVLWTDAVPADLRLAAIVVLAVVQLLIQLVYFLHMGTAPDERTNTAIFTFSALLIVTIVAGSLWVMHNANVNMMPTTMSMEQAKARD
jgi:cytochrome o ubiquinol oxidase operon protein cyoD